NNSPQGKDMTEYYTSKLDNYRAGTVSYPLRDLPQGRNTIKVRAWDTYNNAQVTETHFEVLSSDQLRVVDVMNYPNPFAGETAFTFRHNQAVPVNATVKIYTVAGRLIQSIEKFGANDAFVSIPWDGRDRDGDKLANGVYLYKVVVRTTDGRYTSEALGKLAVAK
ncbi:MAG: T9SS type A sorting domain-containing protein, partial [Ignavibacteriae bacterium]|nr:T9SS type A sorting domain-containing protein [Ignavibacteriota bacterium]